MKKPTPKQIEKKIGTVAEKVTKKMYAGTEGNKFSRGLANEGYLGGYVQALSDVNLYMRGIMPNYNDFWENEK